MTVKLDIEEFVDDYSRGVKDKDLLTKHHINPKELIGIVRKLINEGFISKEQYFDRNRRIQELEAREERDFLKSLYHCPVCSHIHPAPFTICPACGTDITKGPESSEDGTEVRADSVHAAAETDTGNEDLAVIPASHHSPVAPMTPSPPSEVQDFPLRAVPPPPPPPPPLHELPPDLDALIEAPLESVSPVGEFSEAIVSGSYDVVEAVIHSAVSTTFKAMDSSGQGPDLNVKVFHIDALPEESVPELLDKVLLYQSAMHDRNIVKVLGSAVLEGHPALIYEHMPVTLEHLLRDQQECLELDLLLEVLPQILNAVGYSHMHRGGDGVVRRLPHMSLRPERFLFDPETGVVKLDECGLWRSLVEVRGYKRRMWEEPAAELAALAPECFVVDSKFVNAFIADIYALGVALYRLATGKWAFSASGTEEYRFVHVKTFPVPPRVHRWQVPGWFDRMILKCLEKEPAKRWRSATQMELAIGKGLE